MTLSQKGIAFIENQEGCVLHPYLDQANIPTIGIGTTHYPSGVAVSMHDPSITRQDAERFLTHDTLNAAQAVNEYVKSTINQNNFDALCSFAYNCGTGALHGSTLLKLVNANPSDPQIRTAFAMWNKITLDGVHKISPDLVKRRQDEADLYFS